jgi:DNA (cytosine-5)-methyltransferase 1
MSKKLTVGSLFAGIGGFDLGFELAGFDVKWCVEKDKNCQKVLAKRFPQAKIYGDISSIKEDELEKVDVVCGGFPCQDLSVAGKRKGLAGERSGLFYEAIRLVRAIRPEFLVLENVPGLLSSNKGLDFAAVIREMDQGWPCEEIGWRILDSRHFGVPQRRKRIFVVGSARIGGAEKILSLAEGVRGNIEACESKGKKIASHSSGSSGGEGKGRDGFESIVIDRAAFNQGENALYPPRIMEADEVPTLVAKGPHAIAFRKSRRAQNVNDDETWVNDGIANTLNGFDLGDTRTTHAVVAIQGNLIGRDVGGPMGVGASDEGVMYTLTSTDVHAVVTKNIQFDASSFDGMNQKAEQGMHHSLRTGRDSGDFVAINKNDNSKMIIRRLTPVECERLQGFPDGWTDGNSDVTRYKQLGNAVTVNVSRWIAENINTFLQNANTASDTR